MQSIALPKNIHFEKGELENQGRIIVEPCFPGYGVTLGNSIRRVMLSSLPGAAPIGVKIKGADHEFMSLPHIKEDVLEIILNLKQLKLKVYSDEIETLKLNVHGKKKVTAADIEANSQVEVENKDFELANITDMRGSLEAEIFVSKGMGYETTEVRENKSKEIGYIEMDSVFSPIMNVGVKVENVRVGKMTNWDKLILDVTTDGTVEPEDAFKQSVNILINQFNALIGKNDTESEEVKEAEGEEEDK
jgi:DNA-directed RNA polymerase subunit alpha